MLWLPATVSAETTPKAAARPAEALPGPAAAAPPPPPPRGPPAAGPAAPTEACLATLRRAAKAATIQFAVNSARIPPSATPRLTALVTALQNCPGALLEVGGHADPQGGQAETFQLSWQRAEAALAALRDLGGGQAQATLYPVGYGTRRPLATPKAPPAPPVAAAAPAPPKASPAPPAAEPNIFATLFGFGTPAPDTKAAEPPRPAPAKTDAAQPLPDAETAKLSARNRRVEFMVR